MVLIFFLNETMRLSGCLEKKIKVIGLLETFLDDFEKQIWNFRKNIINFQVKNSVNIRFQTLIDFGDDFGLQTPLNMFSYRFCQCDWY